MTDLPPPSPLYHSIEANSEQRQPVHLEGSVRDHVLGGRAPNSQLVLPLRWKVLAERQAQVLLTRLNLTEAELEAWPARSDYGDETWAFSRVRTTNGWRFIEDGTKTDFPVLPSPFLPMVLSPRADSEKLFTDVLSQKDLYAKPMFGDCVWAAEKDHALIEGWGSPAKRIEYQKRYGRRKDVRCFHLPQPARFHGNPVVFNLKSTENGVWEWSPSIEWTLETPPIISLREEEVPVPIALDEQHRKLYKERIRIVAGEIPLPGTKTKLQRKNSAQKDHQIEKLHDYLQAHYRRLGITTERQPFRWRNIKQTNLIAKIPASDPNNKLPPLVIADHTDTAFSEDTFEKTGKRVSNPGADDNATGTAALMLAGESLAHAKLQRPIWLVHLTGEEYPSDDLGARRFLEKLFRDKQDVFAFIVIDMIGHRERSAEKDDRVFQLNPGKDPISLLVAHMIGTEGKLLTWEPKIRDRLDPLSYLYNTDGYIFESWGFPVVLVNENLNRTNMDSAHPHYHKSTDHSSTLDIQYAFDISKSLIRAAWQLCAERPTRNAARPKPDSVLN